MPPNKEALAAFLAEEATKNGAHAAKTKIARKKEEEMLQRHCKNYLDINFTQAELPHWAVRNEIPPPRDGVDPQEWAMRQGKRAKDMGVLAGVCDWHFLYKGIFRVIELKVPGGRVSDNQKLYMETIRKNGGEAYVAWNIEEFHAIVSSWLLVKYTPAHCNEQTKRLLTQKAAAQEMWRND